MQAPKKTPKKRTYLAILIAVFSIGAFFVFQSYTIQQPVKSRSQPSYTPEATEQIHSTVLSLPKPTVLSKTLFTAPDSADLKTALDEIFKNDDYCRLEQLEAEYSKSHPLRKDRQYFSYEILMALLGSTSFSNHYLSYEVARLGGDDPTGYRFGRFIAALANARWLQPVADETFIPKPREAYRLMMLLVHDDPENVAPAAFALAMADTFNGKNGFQFHENERAELLSSLENATRFDTYMLEYLREMASLDDPRATSYLLRVGHLSTIAIPDWSLFQAGFKNAISDDPQLRLKVTDLMMAEAKNARRPSSALSYNVLETAVARALAGKSRAYPTFQDIDRSFVTDDKVDSALFEKALRHSGSDPCTPQYVENVRAYVQHLKHNEMALGVSM